GSGPCAFGCGGSSPLLGTICFLFHIKMKHAFLSLESPTNNTPDIYLISIAKQVLVKFTDDV
ncbi:MAG: hypothetical protein OEX11_06795, partial [Nitrosomonas sp.]|nr:hypothetical protein [Nitrosomonas sp.]